MTTIAYSNYLIIMRIPAHYNIIKYSFSFFRNEYIYYITVFL